MAAKVTYPVHAAEPVSCKTSAALATISAHAADWEHTVAIQSFRYSADASDDKYRELSRRPASVKDVTVSTIRRRA